MRLFVSLEAPKAWRAAATACQVALLDAVEAIDEDAQDALRVVKPELMHVTLRFLGEVEEAGVARLQAALDAVEVPEIRLTLGRAGTFGAPSPTWAIYLAIAEGVEGGLDALRGLVARVEAAVRLAGLTAQRDDVHEHGRQFTPHLTLARVQRSAKPDVRRAIDEAVRALDAPPPLVYVAREIVLVRSYLEGPVPRYEVLSRHGGAPSQRRDGPP